MKYYLPEDGETVKDATEYSPNTHIFRERKNIEHDEWGAECVAEEVYDKRDGYEWMPNQETKIVLVDDDGVESSWIITMEYRPDFYARSVEKNKKHE